MATEWFRTPFEITSTDSDLYVPLGQLSTGQAIRRIHYGWTANAVGNGYDDLFSVVNEQILAGVVTTIGDTSEFPPDPLFQPENQAPPAQRWLAWEARAMWITAFPQVDSGAWSCTTVAPAEPGSGEGQVLAPTMPVGEFLNVWFICQSGQSWPFQVPWYLTGYVSMLVEL